MPRFEVYIPAADEQSLNVTFRVDAANWMAALKTGMQKLGEQGATANNVLVDVHDDNSVHVTEPESGRVFRIRELSDEEANAAAVKRIPVHQMKTQPGLPAMNFRRPSPSDGDDKQTLPGAPAFSEAKTVEVPAREAKLDPAVMVASVSQVEPLPLQPTGVGVPISAVPDPVLQQERPTERGSYTAPLAHQHGRADNVVELERPTKPITGPIGRPKLPKTEREKLEDTLEEVFERVDAVNREADPEKALYFLLDLALEKIPAESGSVLRADSGSGDLTFAAARGPKSKELLASKIVVPHGAGIVGFCSLEGVSVALSDVEKDPRFYPAVSEKLGYETRSVLTSPMMTHGRAFGCFQVLNKTDGRPFSAPEMGLLAYIAHQAALYLNARS